MTYPLLTRATVSSLLPIIDAQRVSLVARGLAKGATPQGFLQAFYAGDLDEMATTNTTYRQRREGFIKRHTTPRARLWRPNGHPTRRHLALISWAYSPDPDGLKRYIQREGLKNRQYARYLGD